MSVTPRATTKGIIARLKAVSGVTDLVSTRIYTNVPDNPTYPFIWVDMSSQGKFATKDENGLNMELRVNAFSEESSPSEADNIIEQVVIALDRQESNISLDEGAFLHLQHSGLYDKFKNEPKIWQAVVGFDVITQ